MDEGVMVWCSWPSVWLSVVNYFNPLAKCEWMLRFVACQQLLRPNKSTASFALSQFGQNDGLIHLTLHSSLLTPHASLAQFHLLPSSAFINFYIRFNRSSAKFINLLLHHLSFIAHIYYYFLVLLSPPLSNNNSEIFIDLFSIIYVYSIGPKWPIINPGLD